MTGIEPAYLTALAPQASVSTNSTTRTLKLAPLMGIKPTTCKFGRLAIQFGELQGQITMSGFCLFVDHPQRLYYHYPLY